MFEFPEYLSDLIDRWELVGSRITCDPPPTDTDQDILILVKDKKLDDFMEELEANKWTKCGGKEPIRTQFPDHTSVMVALEEYFNELNSYGTLGDGSAFESWRQGEFNIIATTDEVWFDKFMEASNCCKALNVLDKDERIEIFNSIVPKQLKKKDANWGAVASTIIPLTMPEVDLFNVEPLDLWINA